MIRIDKKSREPIYKQLYEALKQEAPQSSPGKIPLPPIRALAEELNISKNSVEHAYQQLIAEGYIYAIPGSGYYWSYLSSAYEKKRNSKPLLTVDEVKPRYKYNFLYGNADSKLFPWFTWRKCVKGALETEEKFEHLIYGDKRGYYPLRKLLSEFLKSTRGVECSPEQIVLCSGIQTAISILAALLPPPDYSIAFEEPGYNGIRNTFLRYGCKIVPVPVEEQGISLKGLSETDCKLVFVTPSHQFPMGYSIPIQNRYELLSIMSARRGFIIEDDYDSEFRYGTLAIPSLQSLDMNDCVIYIGTFSKTFSPSLRVSYLVLPNQLLDSFDSKFENYKNTIPDFLQIALCSFIEEGYYSSHLRKIIKANERRYHTIVKLFNSPECPPCITLMAMNAGVHLVIRIDTGRPQKEVIELLKGNNVQLYTLEKSWYDRSSVDHELYLMGFASMDIEEIKEGVLRLFSVIRKMSAG